MWTPGQSYAEPIPFFTVTVLSHLFPHGLSSPYFQHYWGRWHPWDKVASLTPLSHCGHGSHGWAVTEATALPTWGFRTDLSNPAQTLGPHGVLQCPLMLCVRDEITIRKGDTNDINGFIILIRAKHRPGVPGSAVRQVQVRWQGEGARADLHTRCVPSLSFRY